MIIKLAIFKKDLKLRGHCIIQNSLCYIDSTITVQLGDIYFTWYKTSHPISITGKVGNKTSVLGEKLSVIDPLSTKYIDDQHASDNDDIVMQTCSRFRWSVFISCIESILYWSHQHEG